MDRNCFKEVGRSAADRAASLFPGGTNHISSESPLEADCGRLSLTGRMPDPTSEAVQQSLPDHETYLHFTCRR